MDAYYTYVNLLDQHHLAANTRSKTVERIVALSLLVRPLKSREHHGEEKTLEMKLTKLC